jgi:hypothetical protein
MVSSSEKVIQFQLDFVQLVDIFDTDPCLMKCDESLQNNVIRAHNRSVNFNI